MGRYLARRFLFSLSSFFLLIAFGFFLVRFLPGNPFVQDETLDPAYVAKLSQQAGLDRPLWTQYLSYVGELFRGQLGYSIDSPQTKVVTLIAEAFRWTLVLGGLSFLFTIAGSLVLGIFVGASKARQTLFDPVALFVYCMPVLVGAPIFISIFSLHLGWLPITRVDSWLGWILPVVVVSLRPLFKLSRILSDELQKVLNSNSVRTFKSLGFSNWKLQSHWALRESLVVWISYLGVVVVDLLGGSLLVELLFGIPGMGLRLMDAVSARDYLVLTGLILTLGGLVLVVQLLIDWLICWADPRVRL